MGYAFISYSSKNREVTDEIRYILSKNNIDSWVAPDDIPGGSKYAQVINKAIKNCSSFVLLLTEASMNSQWVAKEVERAIHYKKTIIPIKLEDVVLTDEFELYISTAQILTMTDTTESSFEMQSLVSIVKAYAQASTYEKETLEMEILNDARMEDDLQENVGNMLPALKALAKGKKGKRNLIIAVCALVLFLSLIFSTAISNMIKEKEKNDEFNKNYSAIEQNFQNIQNQMENDMAEAGEVETIESDGPNQIPAKYEDTVKALMYSDSLTAANKTLRVKVGGYVTPQSAATWKKVKIYSQDTAVAVGEGLLVKGVSVGNTFVLVEGPGGITSAYYVIVEE